MIRHMKQERIYIKTENHQTEGILLTPPKNKNVGVILAHGAGSDMNSGFLSYFHEKLADAGYPSLKFNFPYMQSGRKVPDAQPVLTAIYRKAIEAMPSPKVVIGGKSMGGRISSYVADEKKVSGLIFLGYPLHPPGKTEQLRDEHLYKINKPMLFVSGTRDPFARNDLLSATLKKIGEKSTLYPIENGGHSFEVPKKLGSRDQIWEEVLRKIEEWLKTI